VPRYSETRCKPYEVVVVVFVVVPRRGANENAGAGRTRRISTIRSIALSGERIYLHLPFGPGIRDTFPDLIRGCIIHEVSGAYDSSRRPVFSLHTQFRMCDPHLVPDIYIYIYFPYYITMGQARSSDGWKGRLKIFALIRVRVESFPNDGQRGCILSLAAMIYNDFGAGMYRQCICPTLYFVPSPTTLT
jgi:hypothetical protein